MHRPPADSPHKRRSDAQGYHPLTQKSLAGDVTVKAMSLTFDQSVPFYQTTNTLGAIL